MTAVRRTVQSSVFKYRFRLDSMESFGLTLLEAITMALSYRSRNRWCSRCHLIDVDPLSTTSVLLAMRSMTDPVVSIHHSKAAIRHSASFEQKFFFVRHLLVLREVIGKEGFNRNPLL
jgi:hypothetical protein